MTTNPGVLRLAPHSPEAEEAVIGGVLTDPDVYGDVSYLKPEQFHINRLAIVWEAVQRVARRGDGIDVLTVSDEIRALGKAEQFEDKTRGFLVNLINRTPTSLHTAAYASMVERLAVRRRLLTAADEIKALAYDTEISVDALEMQCPDRVLRVFEGRDDSLPVSMREAVNRYFDRIEQTQHLGDGVTGLASGFRDFDALTDGFQPGSLNLLGARPKMGKSALLLCVALHVARRGGRVLIWSGEMPVLQLLERFMAVETGINTVKLRRGLRPNGLSIEGGEWSRFTHGAGNLGKLPIFIDDTPGVTPRQLAKQVKRIERQVGKLDLIVTDYIGLMSPGEKRQNREQEIAYISKSLKELAMESAPIFAAQQLNRDLEKRNDKRPIPADLRDSGTQEQDADMVTFLYRDLVYNPNTEFPNAAEWIVSMNRHGATGVIRLHFERSLTRFTDAATQTIDLSSL